MHKEEIKVFNGIKLTDLPIEKIISKILENPNPGCSYVVTPNADHFYRLDEASNIEFINSYKHAYIRICDSRIIQKLSFLESQSIQNVIPGSDLTRIIIESNWAKEHKLLVVGPEPREVESIRKKYNLPNLQSYTPPMGFISSEQEVSKCIDVIYESQADIVFLALGSPQQEIMANRTKLAIDKKTQKKIIMLCIGASFDFLSGKINRAPKIIQNLHLEWLHRALSNPIRLLPRYWRNFLWLTKYVFRKIKPSAL